MLIVARGRTDPKGPRSRPAGDTAPTGGAPEGQNPDGGLRRDGLRVLFAVLAPSAAAWIYLLTIAIRAHLAATGAVGMPDHVEVASSMRAVPACVAGRLTMWLAMMVAMMTPTAAPILLAYARYGGVRTSRRGTLAATVWFAIGYLSVWAIVAVVATFVQWRLERLTWLEPGKWRVGLAFDGLLLLIAGLYQLTPIKSRLLRMCQAPGQFIRRYGGFQADAAAATLAGLRQGIFCLGASWALMMLLFVGGVMNLAWIAGLSALIFVEKITPKTRLVSRLAALVLVAAGDWMFFLALQSAGIH